MPADAHALPLLPAAAERVKRLAFDAEDRWFEWRHGLELGKLVPHDELVADDPVSRAHATAYMGVWSRNVRALVREARRLQPGLGCFVDIGAGKGKACFYASTLPGFDRIIGIEFSPPLLAVAHRNHQTFGGPQIEFICADANTWLLPERRSLVFMFNPFDAVVLERFLIRNHAHFSRQGSLLAYANDVHHDVPTRLGHEMVFRDPARHLSLFRLG